MEGNIVIITSVRGGNILIITSVIIEGNILIISSTTYFQPISSCGTKAMKDYYMLELLVQVFHLRYVDSYFIPSWLLKKTCTIFIIVISRHIVW